MEHGARMAVGWQERHGSYLVASDEETDSLQERDRREAAERRCREEQQEMEYQGTDEQDAVEPALQRRGGAIEAALFRAGDRSRRSIARVVEHDLACLTSATLDVFEF